MTRAQVIRAVENRIDQELAIANEAEIETLIEHGASEAEIQDHRAWRREVNSRWRERSMAEFSRFLDTFDDPLVPSLALQ